VELIIENSSCDKFENKNKINRDNMQSFINKFITPAQYKEDEEKLYGEEVNNNFQVCRNEEGNY